MQTLLCKRDRHSIEYLFFLSYILYTTDIDMYMWFVFCYRVVSTIQKLTSADISNMSDASSGKHHHISAVHFIFMYIYIYTLFPICNCLIHRERFDGWSTQGNSQRTSKGGQENYKWNEFVYKGIFNKVFEYDYGIQIVNYWKYNIEKVTYKTVKMIMWIMFQAKVLQQSN